MENSPADRAEQAVAVRLRSQDVRFTRARRMVVRILAEAEGPLAAGELHRELAQAVPLSSLYRTLAILEKSAVITKQHDGLGRGRYELAEWLTGHHHHLVCESCGEVRDVAVSPATERMVINLVDRIAARAGYRATGHRIDIQGTCRVCRQT